LKHNLLTFLFFAVLLAMAYHFAFGLTYEHFFAGSFAFQTYWVVPFILVPTLLLAGLGWLLGFWRSLGWADLAAAAIVVAIVYLNLDASYSCGSGCF
jgi:hypothetical protein